MPGRSSGSFYGVQCKGKDAGYSSVLTVTELNREVEKAGLCTPALKNFIMVTTAPRDVHLQQHTRELSEARAERGGFRVQVLAWEDIQSLLADYPEVIERFYPEHAFDIPALLRAVQAMPKGQDVTEILSLVRQDADAHRHLLTNGNTSEIAMRFRTVLELMNEGRTYNKLTIAKLASMASLPRAGELERYFSGEEEPTFAFVDHFSSVFGVNRH